MGGGVDGGGPFSMGGGAFWGGLVKIAFLCNLPNRMEWRPVGIALRPSTYSM